jgi:SEFIR domain
MNPKLFVSYSWSSPPHIEWVLRLATDLRSDGVDVILDKWDLKEGNDANVFMEKMVSDPTVRKVILVCDKVYVEKANKRAGGVGTEAQIISPALYAKTEQSKLITERDERGDALIPIYYGPNVYIDFSDQLVHPDSYDQLIRWIFDKPEYVKSELGSMPKYLETGESQVVLNTSTCFRRAIEAVKHGREYSAAAVREYLDKLTTELEKFRVNSDEEPFDDLIVRSLEKFIPYRNELIEMFLIVSSYSDDIETMKIFHRFFEKLIVYFHAPRERRQWNTSEFDNFKFIVHELFLYAIACFMANERFALISHLLSIPYLDKEGQHGQGAALRPFRVLYREVASLQNRNIRLGLNKISLRAEIIKDRCRNVPINFDQLMEADFIMYVRTLVDPVGEVPWYPITLIYCLRHRQNFESIARAASRSYFDEFKAVLGVANKDELSRALERLEASPTQLIKWQFETLIPSQHLNLEQIASMP